MKLNLPLLNSIGCQNSAQKALLGAFLLKTATVSSPAVVISKLVPAILAKAEIIAQTAKLARAATAAVPADPANPAYGFGELYLNSPPYAAGAALPAIPAKPASAAVVGVPAVIGVPAVPAVTAPAIVALKGWEDAIAIAKSASEITITAYLPYATSPALIGAPTNGVDGIKEISPSLLQPLSWLDAKASDTPETTLVEVLTIEQLLYKQALALGTACAITNVIKSVNGVSVACKKLVFTLQATAYDINSEALQMGKLSAVN